ncbi:hypothetical protein V8F33_013554, partial [Rhypophila sp. PSN 637]
DGERQPLLQRPFTTGFAQYLGRISYSLYLSAILPFRKNCICWRYLFRSNEAWGKAQETVAGLVELGSLDEAAATLAVARRAWAWNYIWAFCFNTLVVLWVSDLFYRFVDVNSVRLARRVWAWVSKG